jgi:type IV secretory pathway VirJ component
MHSLLKNKFIFIGIAVALVIVGVAYFGLHKSHSTNTQSASITNQEIDLRGNGKAHVFFANNPEKGLLLYIVDPLNSANTKAYAQQFAELSYYVVVIDKQFLLSAPSNTTTGCLNIANKLTAISKDLQSHFKLDDDELPILVGSDGSSAVVYAALAQAGEHKFHAAVSINLTPQLTTDSPLCEQQTFAKVDGKQWQLTAVKRLPTSFYIFQDDASTAASVDHSFTDNISNVKLTIVDSKKQPAVAEAIQILQWLDPRLADQISSDASDSDLPLIEVPVNEVPVSEVPVSEEPASESPTNEATITQKSIDSTQQTNEQLNKKLVSEKSANEKSANEKSANKNTTDSIAVIITGDGGWAEIDKNIAKNLAQKGIPAVALDSLSYFWKARSPEETAKDIETVITQYLEKWNKKNVILIGYSFGADALPFVANNLRVETQRKISLIALLGMGKTAAFEFRLSSWMDADTNSDRLPLLPEIAKMTWANSICIYGIDDPAANCKPTAEFGVKIISMSGDHHFDEKYDELVQHIIENTKPN